MKKLLTISTALFCLTAAACAPGPDTVHNDSGDNNYRYNSGRLYPNNSVTRDGVVNRDYEDNYYRDTAYIDTTYDNTPRYEGMVREFFARIDANNDGYISRNENSNFSVRMFRYSDTNRDGRVTFEEFVDAKRRQHDRY